MKTVAPDHGGSRMYWRAVTQTIGLRGFFLCLIVSAALLGATPTRAQAPAKDPAAAEALIQKMKDVFSALGAFEESDNQRIQREHQELIKKLKDLKDTLKPPAEKAEPSDEELGRLATTISQILSPEVAAKNWAAELTGLLKMSSVSLGNEELRGKIQELKKTLKELMEPASTPVATELRKQVLDLEKELQQFKPLPATLPEGAERVLLDLAKAISRKMDSTDAVTLWATDLIKIIGRWPTIDPELKALITKLRNELPPPSVELGPYLNIVQAWYGDLEYITLAASGQLRVNRHTGTGRRVCDATLEVRSACQGRSVCPFPVGVTGANPGTNTPATTKLCGEHPAPLANNDTVGLAIEYQCLSKKRAIWDKLETDWKIEPDDFQPKTIRVRSSNFGTAKIRCTAELPETKN